MFIGIDAYHADHEIILIEVDAAYTGGVASDGPGVFFVETAALALVAGQQDLATAAGQGGADQGIAVAQVDGDDAAHAGTGIGFEQGLLDGAVSRGQDYIMTVRKFLVVEILDVEVGLDAVFHGKREDVLDGASLGGLGAFRNIVHLEPEAFAALRKEHQRAVHVGDVDVLDEIFVAGGAALGADAAAALRAVFGQRGTLDVAEVRDRDDNVLIRVEVFRVEIFRGGSDLGAARVAVFFLEVAELVLDDAQLHLFAAEHLLVVGDQFLKLVVFGLELVAFQSGELAETHLYDGVGLLHGEAELGHQPVPGIRYAAGGTDQGDDLVDDVEGFQEAFEDMGTLEGFVEFEPGAAHHHFVAVTHEILDQLLEVELLRPAVHQGDVVDREARLERREFEQVVEHHVGRGALFEFDDDAHAVAVAFVIDVGDAFQFLAFDQFGDALDEFPLVDGVGDLGHDDGLAARRRHFDVGLGPDDDAAPAGLEGVADAAQALDDAAGGEVGTFDVLHQAVHVDVGVVDIGADGVTAFRQVVGRHVGGHTYGDAVGAVHQQQRRLGRQDSRLLERFVEIRLEIDGILIQVGQDFFGQLLEFGLGVSHGRHRVAVDGTEVALSVDKQVAQVPGLGQAGHRVVNAGVTVRVVFTEDVADDTGGLLHAAAVGDTQVAHSEEDAPVHRLKSVSYIG